MATKIITINFTPASPAPAAGYVVRYRPVGTTVYTTVTPNPTASPVKISVEGGLDYEGDIKSDCGSSLYSTPVYWFVEDAAAPVSYPATGYYTSYGYFDQAGACADAGPYNSPLYSESGSLDPGKPLYWDAAATQVLPEGFYNLGNSDVLQIGADNNMVGTSVCAGGGAV
jgi:hypothetical protein